MSDQPIIRDKLGQAIKEGDYIVYGHAMGRSAGLRVGKVLRLDFTNDPDRYRYRRGDCNCRIWVWGVDDDSKYSAPILCKHMGILEFPERVIVVPEPTVSEDYRKLLALVDAEIKPKKRGTDETPSQE